MTTDSQGLLQDQSLDLRALQALNPPTTGSLSRWIASVLSDKEPDFLAACVEKQLTANTQRSAQIRRGEKPPRKAPLAGVLTGPRGSLYDAFFTMIKANVMAHHQQAAIQNGITFKGLQDHQVLLSERDFINPFTVLDGSGVDIDLSAEADLLHLGKLTSESARAFQGEEVKSRLEEAAEKESTFAHADVDVIPPALRLEAAAQGVTLPYTVNLEQLAEAARLLPDDYLRAAVEGCLNEQEQLADRARVYLTKSRQPLFTVKATASVGHYRPYTPTPTDQAHDLPTEASPLAGWSAFDETQDASSERPTTRSSARQVISRAAFSRMVKRLDELCQAREQLLKNMEAALEDGDLSESSFYDETRTALQANDHETASLRNDLEQVEPGDVGGIIGKVIRLQLGRTRRTVQLVDGEPAIGQVSISSPLGQLLNHAQVGEELSLTKERTVVQRRSELMPVRSGTETIHLQVPEGIRRPVLPEVRPTYHLEPIQVSHTASITQHLCIRVLSIRDPLRARKVTVDFRQPLQRHRA